MSARASGRVGFPAKNFPKERVFCKPYSSHFVHSAIGSRMNRMITVHSENGIAPKRTQIPSIPSIPIPE